MLLKKIKRKPTRKTALGKWGICSLLHVHSFQAQAGASYKIKGLELSLEGIDTGYNTDHFSM